MNVLAKLREAVRGMAGYVPGEQLNAPDVIKLNTNENPYPPSPRVIEAIQNCLTSNHLRKYPQPLGDDFRTAAGRVLGVNPDAILIGNGSDDLLTILTRAFVPERGLMVSPTPSYSLYRTLAQLQGAVFRTVPFTQDWTLPEIWPEPTASLTLLPNPNSPSGTMLALSAVQVLAAQIDGPLILDEAYADFADFNGLSLFGRVPNVIVTRSFSKYYSLAGVRFGFAVADPAVIRELVKVKDSYNCDVLSIAAATAAIHDQEYYQGLKTKLLATRQRLLVELEALGFRVTPSQANFLWCRHERLPHRPIYEELKRRNVLIRFMSYDGYGDGLRISVGTDAETDRLFVELRTIL